MAIDFEQLSREAKRASEHAYAKYSGFRVGAAVLSSDGRVFSGCNVENASLGLTICAERAAVFAAVAKGATELTAIAVYSPTPEPTMPCGACRQVLAEFAEDMPIFLCGCGDAAKLTSLKELLPGRFSL